MFIRAIFSQRKLPIALALAASPLCGMRGSTEAKCTSSPPLGKNFIADTVEVASPSVVNIVIRTHFGEGSGSGFIISKDGFLVTNAHVIMNDLGAKCVVTLWDGRKMKATVHSADKKSDIALLKVDGADKGVDLPVAKIGCSGSLRSGDFCVALGSPLRLSNSVSFGIISQTARYGVDLFSGLPMGGGDYQKTAWIQTDAAITKGNSGGPLVNIDGHVIGINTLSAHGVQGLSFAIPIDAAMAIVEQLRTTGRVVRPYIGIQMQDFFNGKERRVRVRTVDRDGPAERAGLRSGDTILRINGKDITGVRDVYKVGFKVKERYDVQVRHANGDIDTITITAEPELERARRPWG